jgi:hypothetical protein
MHDSAGEYRRYPPNGYFGVARDRVLYVGVSAYSAGTSHMRAAYHTAHATRKSDITQTQTGMDERVDRLMHKAELLNLAGKSYRFKEAQERTARNAPAAPGS